MYDPLGIILVMTPPTVSIPKLRGVVSKSIHASIPKLRGLASKSMSPLVSLDSSPQIIPP